MRPSTGVCLGLLSIVAGIFGHAVKQETGNATAYIGCYIDNGASDRLLQGLQKNFHGILTPDMCINHCFNYGFAYAGTQYRFECFCSISKPPDGRKTDDNQCNTKCAGDETKNCGGIDRLSIYSTGVKEAGYAADFVGCYIDNGPGNRLMQGLQQNFPETLTPEICNKFCFNRDFAYAGTQYSFECFCSKNKPPNIKKSDENQCDMKCAGDKNKICGGPNRLSVHSTGIIEPGYATDYIGCYIDGGPENRLMQGLHKNFPETLTPDICNRFCFLRGFAYAGSQYSFQCFCSKTKPPNEKKTDETQCNMKCAGDENKNCGAHDRLSIHSTGFNESDYAPNFIGCYIDSGPRNRLMQGLHENFPKTLTPDICNRFCFHRGFVYAGTQYSVECFCSNIEPTNNKKTYDSECDMKCAGDGRKNCGGTNRLSVHTTGIIKPDDGTNFIGCYVDNGKENRLMKGLQKNFHGSLTPDVCNRYCFHNGFAYAATQYSFECFCSKNKPPDDKRSVESQCDMKCAGDDNKKCGGANRLSVHSTGLTESDYNVQLRYIGCFKEYTNGSRIMTGYRQDFPSTLTNQLCVKTCGNRGFRFAGMQYGKECFCDNQEVSYKHYAVDGDCTMACEGNLFQLCGGFFRLSVFTTINTGSETPYYAGNYIGCYKDQDNPRMFKGHTQHFGIALNPFRCTGLCYLMGFLYAATQYGEQCFCGDERPSPNLKVLDSECNKECTGDPTQKCGGDFRNSIHETGIPDFLTDVKYLGCFVDDSNNRLFKDLKTDFDKTNSPRRCLNYCWQFGFKYCGVEYGKECFCSNEQPSAEYAVNGDQCSTPCTGNTLKSCGANFRLAVYSSNLSTAAKPLMLESVLHSSATTIKPCQLSQTTVNGETACMSEVIFTDDFNSTLGSKWKNTVMYPETPNYEFTVFNEDTKNFFVSENKLVIKPTLFNDTHVLTGSFNLQGCTGNIGTRECGYQAFSFNILPPVASARVNTHHSFAFRYGIVEIRAKLPVGDWLIPELWLEPKSHPYGQNYASGRIRIAMSRGNQQLQCGGQDFGSTRLECGIVMGPDNNVKIRSITSTVPADWHNEFHTYTLFWEPDSITFKIDDEFPQSIVSPGEKLCEVIGFTSEECAIWNSGSKIAPFDNEFYISLGLSAGNARDFPDDCMNRGSPKPWKNMETKAMLKFWQDKKNWSTTWSDDKSALYIKYVKVTAL